MGMILKMSSLWVLEKAQPSLDITLYYITQGFLSYCQHWRAVEREETTSTKKVTGTELLMSKNFKQTKRVGRGYVSDASLRQLS